MVRVREEFVILYSSLTHPPTHVGRVYIPVQSPHSQIYSVLLIMDSTQPHCPTCRTATVDVEVLVHLDDMQGQLDALLSLVDSLVDRLEMFDPDHLRGA